MNAAVELRIGQRRHRDVRAPGTARGGQSDVVRTLLSEKRVPGSLCAGRVGRPHQVHLDEAFLDISGALRLLGDAPSAAGRVRADVLEATGLSCSVGVATSKLVAKLASEAAKPGLPGAAPRVLTGARRTSEGVVLVAPGDERVFLHAHPVQALWGVGPATLARLDRFGVRTVGDLAALSPDVAIRALGAANGRHLHALANAVDDRAVQPDREVKSIGHEETFPVDHRDLRILRTEIIRMADAVAVRMRAAGVAGRTVTLKVKFPDFRLITRARTATSPLGSGTAIAEVADALLREHEVAASIERTGVRLLGVSVSGLTARATSQVDEQLALFAAVGADDGPGSSDGRARSGGSPRATGLEPQSMKQVDDVVAAIRARFGTDAVAPAVLAAPGGLRVKRAGDTQWGPPGDG